MPVPQHSPSSQAEAARYALLRRLASSMRHHLVVNLQPIGMIYEVMDRRLRAPVPDLRHVQDSAAKINTFAKAALASCVDVVSWFAPDDAATVTVEDAARECATLLATSFSFRGYALRNQVEPVPGTIRRAAGRHLVAAALIHCTDHRPAPADIVLSAAAEDGMARVTVTVRPAQGGQAVATEANYRAIEWSDLEALANADGVQLAREGDTITLRFPVV